MVQQFLRDPDFHELMIPSYQRDHRFTIGKRDIFLYLNQYCRYQVRSRTTCRNHGTF